MKTVDLKPLLPFRHLLCGKERLVGSGYVPGIPNQRTLKVDLALAAELSCGECSHKGLRIRPFIRRETNGYRVLAICPKCLFVEEI